MNRVIFLLLIGIFFSGCRTTSLNLKDEYQRSVNEFDQLLSFSIKERARKNMEKDFTNLKRKIIEDKTIDAEEKTKLLNEIDYKLMILSDLK